MPQSPPTDQLASTPSGRPRPDAALLTGSGWAEPRTAIQESVYAILGHGHFQRRVLFTGMLSSAVLVMQALAYQLICREVPHWCAPPDNLRYLPPDAWRNAAIPLQADGSYSQCTVYEPPVPCSVGAGRVPDPHGVSVTRFFVSASSCSLQVLVFILIYEVTGNDRRGLFGVLATALGTHAGAAPGAHAGLTRAPLVPWLTSFLLLPTANAGFLVLPAG
ncbi:hypothetical protein HPB48_004212 [Haemaphysalis longicornis]|uniref:Uncharacterized protein n=1 Tax=Haemaphysalis longicornis TaxID=44386 RepID=A0A9J6GBA3_HAELO|nr:hypothetical protein HPB48_004212 [Haemaphysalis longicornis]